MFEHLFFFFFLSKLLFKDNICKDNYFYFILLCRVLAVSVSWFFEICRVPVSRRVVSPWPYPCPCFLGQRHLPHSSDVGTYVAANN